MSEFRELSLDDIEALAVGAWILGTGGGGSPYLGLLNMRALYAEGHRVRLMPPDALLFACTGAFPPMPGDAGVVFPSRILAGLSAGLLPQGRLGLLVPAPEQIETLSRKWQRDGVEVVAEALIPSAGEAEAEAAAARLAQHRPDLVAMDCMSYTPAAKAAVRRAVGVPTLLAVTATAAVLRELLS